MKYIKNFENNNNELSIYDYVVIKTNDKRFTMEYNEFLSNHIGRVNEIYDDVFYADFYPNVGDSKNVRLDYCHNTGFSMSDLKYHSKDFDYLENILLYNL